MKIIKNAKSGTLESSDIQIMLVSNENAGIEIELKSNVQKQFGNQIKKVIKETLEEMGIDDIRVVATDKGALDCTIKARVECAVYRACGIKKEYDWEVIDQWNV
ncbi:citrate lyase acyl carrier protein [Clostridium sp. CM027]|uniref:citrate lyase acyl carrier protein n=1 Tax=Clostridium sp. CM027 TaxID=2849865 RepID=UPI001C6E12CD|nr:citrate lyase acyl carrier protein [Clostridium sp. CM027]MBW9147171.1 citrate lyase acyl carrier protein [Clostridium sp. CM027]UVE39537.1 citrate lyase acyl carrier protein [Clostridium sp. CM027]